MTNNDEPGLECEDAYAVTVGEEKQCRHQKKLEALNRVTVELMQYVEELQRESMDSAINLRKQQNENFLYRIRDQIARVLDD